MTIDTIEKGIQEFKDTFTVNDGSMIPLGSLRNVEEMVYWLRSFAQTIIAETRKEEQLRIVKKTIQKKETSQWEKLKIEVLTEEHKMMPQDHHNLPTARKYCPLCQLSQKEPEWEKEIKKIVCKIIKWNMEAKNAFDPLWSKDNPNGVLPIDYFEELTKFIRLEIKRDNI